MKKLPLLLLLSTSSAFAGPFSNTDARSMAMGDTGVAASKPGTAGIFNPALLSAYADGEKFSLIFTDLSGSASANSDTIDGFEDIEDKNYAQQITDTVDQINALVDNFDTASDAQKPAIVTQFANATSSVAPITQSFSDALANISGEALSLDGNLLLAAARPNKDLGMSLYLNIGGAVETGLNVATCDRQLLTDFGQAIASLSDPTELNVSSDATSICEGETRVLISASDGEIQDPDSSLSSGFNIALIQQTEIGLSLSRQFRLSGYKVAFGITPKMITITSQLAEPSLRTLDDDTYDLRDDLEAHEAESSSFDLDVGVAANFLSDDSLKVGVVIKNLLSPSFDTKPYTGSSITRTVKVDTAIRAGVAWSKIGFTLAADLDLTEDDGFLGGTDTQFLSLGAEYDLFNTFRVRGGMRSNLSDADDTAFTLGMGVNIIAAHFDLGLQVSEFNAGLAMQLGLEF